MSQAIADPTPVARAAIAYAAKGIPVFPCRPDKTPHTRRGFLDATTDIEQINEWWTRWPVALVGMPTGRVSGMVAVDLDKREGYDGADALSELEDAYEKLPHTIESLTAGGGRHLFFDAPEEDVRNSASKLGLGIDVRGDGGYVILPPSQLPDGRTYEWEASNPQHRAALPAWMLRLLGATVQPQSVVPTPAQSSAVSGQRNVYLASLAGRLANAGLSREQVRAAVLAENQRACTPPLEEGEIDRTVMKSASRWVMSAMEDARAEAPAPENPDEAKRLKWYPASEWAANPQAPEWIVRDVIEAATVNTIIGGWGSGKSAVVMDMPLCIAHGRTWQDRNVEQGLVVYVVGEGQRGFQRRVAAWHKHRGEPLTDRLIIIPEAVLLGQPDHEVALHDALLEIQAKYGLPVRMVVLDTLARCFGLENENSNSDMARWLYSLQGHIIDPTGAAVVALHHPGHGDKGRGRGGSALPGAADTEWLLVRDETTVVMRATKTKDGDAMAEFAWWLRGVDLVLGGEVVSVVTAEECEMPEEELDSRRSGGRVSPALERTLDGLYMAHKAARVANEKAMEEGRPYVFPPRVDREDWHDFAGVKNRDTFRKYVNRLLEQGLVREDERGCWPVVKRRDEDET